MNAMKIGQFIMTCRKEKGLTQKELADIIGVTDKSVSKWERGINLPESSLFIPLCDALNIQVQELLSGEHIQENELLNKSNELLIDLSKDKIKDKEAVNTFKMTLFIILFPIILLYISYYEFITSEILNAILFILKLYTPMIFIWSFMKMIQELIKNQYYSLKYFIISSLSLLFIIMMLGDR